MCSNGQPNLSGDCAADYPDDDFCSGACLPYVGCLNCPEPEATVRDCGVETEFSGSAPRRPNPRPPARSAPHSPLVHPSTPRLPQS